MVDAFAPFFFFLFNTKRRACEFFRRDNHTWLSASKLPPYVDELFVNHLGHQVIFVGEEAYKMS